jgi:hypothetical protein
MNNIYATNFSEYSKLGSQYLLEKQKKLLTKLSNSLLDNQWIRTTTNFEEDLNYKYNTQNKITWKPNGIYFSKGEWIFHILCCNPNDNIILVKINYDNIHTITNKKPNNYKIDKYYLKKLYLFRKKYSVNKKNYELINYKDILKQYSGFAIYPFIHNPQNTFLAVYDCSTLILWNNDAIINYYNLGIVSDYINIDKKIMNKYNISDIPIIYTTFINELIKKINKINNI